jgi:hypothetical protein
MENCVAINGQRPSLISRSGTLRLTGGDVLSPATMLEHEADHAFSKIVDGSAQYRRTQDGDSNFTNAEEKRVITGNETKTARANGEISKNKKYSRYHHGGNSIKRVHTESPISTKVNKAKTIELRKRIENRSYAVHGD